MVKVMNAHTLVTLHTGTLADLTVVSSISVTVGANILSGNPLPSVKAGSGSRWSTISLQSYEEEDACMYMRRRRIYTHDTRWSTISLQSCSGFGD
jgi:hypothetical protein